VQTPFLAQKAKLFLCNCCRAVRSGYFPFIKWNDYTLVPFLLADSSSKTRVKMRCNVLKASVPPNKIYSTSTIRLQVANKCPDLRRTVEAVGVEYRLNHDEALCQVLNQQHVSIIKHSKTHKLTHETFTPCQHQTSQ